MAAITEIERQRILEIISAVESNDWQRFKFLSDDPFLNEQSMLQQFEASRKKVSSGFGDWEELARAEILEDGSRVIMVRIQPRSQIDQEILLTLHNRSERISIWLFYENIEFSRQN